MATSDLLIGTQTQDLPTITIAGVTPSPINIAGLYGKTERGEDGVIRLTDPDEIAVRLGRYRSSNNAHYAIKGFFENLQGIDGTLYFKRMVPSDAVAATVGMPDAGASGDDWNFTAGYRGKADKGIWGNQLWVNIVASSRGNSDVAANVSSADTAIEVVSVAPFEVGDWIVLNETATPTSEYFKITSIDESSNTLNLSAAVSAATFTTANSSTVAIVDFTVEVYKKDSDTGNVDLVEQWPNVAPDADSPFYVETIINDEFIGSQYVTISDDHGGAPADEDDFPDVAATGFANATQLTTGAEGTSLNDAAMGAGLSAFDDYPIRYLANCEAFSETIYTDGEQYCNVRKDCIWVGTPDWSDAQAFASLLVWAQKRQKSRNVYSVNNGSWYYVTDPISSAPNPVKRVPNVGHMMGYIIYITSTRGIHKVPASTTETPVGIQSLAFELTSRRNLRDLANAGLNMQTVDGGNFPIRSARTPSKLPEFTFVNATAMKIYFKKSFEQSFADLENEPNKGNLLNRLRAGMAAFAQDFFQSSSNGGNEGGFAEGSFNEVVRIVADDSNNPKAKINAGEVRGDFWFAAPSPAERILIGVGLLFNV